MPRAYYNFYRIYDRDDELSRSNDSIIESGSSMTLYCTENLSQCLELYANQSRLRTVTLQSVTLTTWPSLRL